MKMNGGRGAILVQVLIMGCLLLMLVTLLVKAVNQNFHLGAYVVGEARETKNAETSVNSVYNAWATASVTAGTPQNCITPAAGSCGYIQVVNGAANSCNCRVQVFIKQPDCSGASPFVRYPDVVASVNGSGDCQFQTDLTQQVGQYSYP